MAPKTVSRSAHLPNRPMEMSQLLWPVLLQPMAMLRKRHNLQRINSLLCRKRANIFREAISNQAWSHHRTGTLPHTLNKPMRDSGSLKSRRITWDKEDHKRRELISISNNRKWGGRLISWLYSQQELKRQTYRHLRPNKTARWILPPMPLINSSNHNQEWYLLPAKVPASRGRSPAIGYRSSRLTKRKPMRAIARSTVHLLPPTFPVGCKDPKLNLRIDISPAI